MNSDLNEDRLILYQWHPFMKVADFVANPCAFSVRFALESEVQAKVWVKVGDGALILPVFM